MNSHYIVSTSVYIFFVLGLCVNGLYEDQIGKDDWRKQYIGKAKYILLDNTSHRVVLGTERNVLASLNSKNGEIVWRHVFESNGRGVINHVSMLANEVIVVIGGGILVRKFQLTSGILLKEMTLNIPHSENVGAKLVKNDLLLWTSTHVAWIRNGDSALWTAQLPDNESVVYKECYMSELGESDIFCIGVSTSAPSKVLVVKVDKRSGSTSKHTSVTTAWFKPESTRCFVTAFGSFVCLDDVTDTLHSLDITKGQQFIPISLPTNLSSKLKSHSSLNIDLMKIKHEKYVDDIVFTMLVDDTTFLLVLGYHSNKLKLIKVIEGVSTSSFASLEGRPVLTTVSHTREKDVELNTYLLTEDNQAAIVRDVIQIGENRGDVEMCVSYLASSKKVRSTITYRMMCVCEEHTLMMITHSTSSNNDAHQPVWIRDEALASLTSVIMLDLPVSENLASFEEEFGSQQTDIVSMFINRLHTQFEQFKLFIERFTSRLVETPEERRRKSLSLIRDYFSLNKVILGVSTNGKLLALHTIRGEIVWSKYITGLTGLRGHLMSPHTSDLVWVPQTYLPLLVHRTTAHFPSEPVATLVAQDEKSGNGVLLTFNPINGKPIGDNGGVRRLNFPILQYMLMGHVHDQHYLKPLLLLDKNLKVHVHPPELFDVVKYDIDNTYMFICDHKSPKLQGYSLIYDRNKRMIIAEETWSMSLPTEQSITHVLLKNPLEQVHSPGRVLGDRSVLYKYLNPNLAVIATASDDKSVMVKGQDGVIDLYLLDMITGHLVFSIRHPRSSSPLHILISENWLIYSYWNQKERRTDVAVVELYEGLDQHNATCFDSFHPPPDPLVMRQGYILPHLITAMTVSVTEKGITHKDILVSMTNGGILQIPKLLFDPRRPTIMTPELREEGVVPYIPELHIPTENIINYNQSTQSIHTIYCAPAGLESTSLVLVYGLDLFYTHIHPSKMFDLLKDDFDYWLISVVCGGLLLATVLLQKLSARKQLKKAWK